MKGERTTGLGAGPRKALAAEGLDANHGADHVPVYIDVSYVSASRNEFDGFVYARVNAEREAVPRAVDVIDEPG